MKVQTRITLWFTVVLIFSFATSKAQSVTSQRTEQPAVIKAVAPSVYPAIAVAVKAEGKVTVEVKINEDGEVKSAKGVDGHPLLQAVSSVAAKRWRFAPAVNETKDRVVNLTFIFRLLSDKEQQETSFNPPYEIVYAIVPPKVKQVVNY